eukprot:gene25364-biopygen20978
MPDTVQEWHAEDVIFETCLRILQAFWHPKLAKRCLKHAPQRRAHARSLEKSPIDGQGAQHLFGGLAHSLSLCSLGIPHSRRIIAIVDAHHDASSKDSQPTSR